MQQSPADSRGVSPIIGGVMMVAITVILAAVIGTFVLGLAGNVNENVQAGVTIEEDPDADRIKVVWTTNQNADHLEIEACSTSSTMDSVGEYAVTGCSDAQVDVIVTGVNGDDRTVLISRTIDLTG